MNPPANNLFTTAQIAQVAGMTEADIRRRVASHEVIIGFGHPVYTVSDPRSHFIKEQARALAVNAEGLRLFSIAERIESTMQDAKRMFPNLLARKGLRPVFR